LALSPKIGGEGWGEGVAIRRYYFEKINNYEEGNMPSDGEKTPLEELKDKLRSFFGTQDPQKKKNALTPKAHFSIWYSLMAFLLFASLQQYFFSAKVETIPYSQFKQYIAEGILSKVTIGPEDINGTIKGPGETPGQDQKFTTVRVSDPDLRWLQWTPKLM
jgi:cell division protease FtsH